MKAQDWLYRTTISRQGISAAPSSLLGLLAATTLLMLIVLGFFLHGGSMGLYMDDYSVKAWAFDFTAKAWKLMLVPFYDSWTMRPLTLLLEPNIANALPRYGFVVRLGIVLIHLVNVCLLARLGQRLSGSWSVGVLAGACFLFPVFANEAVLWFTAAVSNTLCLLFLLVGFNLVLSCRSFADSFILACGIASWFLMILFYESGLFIVLLLPAFFVLTKNEAHRANPKLWIAALAGSFIPITIYLRFVELKSPDVIARGGASFNLSFMLWHKVPEAAGRFWWLLTEWGVFGPLREALKLGWREWSSRPGGQALMAGAVAGICLVALLAPARSDPIPPVGRLLNLALAGFAWITFGLLPIVLIKGQIVEIRTLYIPSAGIALSVAAFLAAAITLFGSSKVVIRGLTLITGALLILSSLTMAGLVRTYELRWDLDQRQVQALSRVMPMIPPANPIWMLPVGLDEKTVSKSLGKDSKLDVYLDGVFENSWSARDSVRLKFGERNIEALASNRWVGLHLTSMQLQPGQVKTITLQGATVRVDQILAFTYRDGEVILLNPLEIDETGTGPTFIDLPVISRLAGRGFKIETGHVQLEHEGLQSGAIWKGETTIAFEDRGT